jgi:hypothetical protein
MSVAEIDEGVFEATATIDNGSFGTRTIRFETGRLAQQAAGSVVAYLDDETMLLSATTASKAPKEHFDFFPLTIDVEERMYAAGRIPGSFFRREGRPSTDAILTCRLIDRIGSRHVRLHLDVKAMASEEIPIPEIVVASAPHLEHFHANDVNLQGPGFGGVDFAPIFTALDEVRYAGWVSVEVFDYAPGPERLARESIAYMRRIEAGLG